MSPAHAAQKAKALVAPKVIVFAYILAAPFLPHPAIVPLTNQFFQAGLATAAVGLMMFDVTLGALALFAVLVMIGLVNNTSGRTDRAQSAGGARAGAAAANASRAVNASHAALRGAPVTAPAVGSVGGGGGGSPAHAARAAAEAAVHAAGACVAPSGARVAPSGTLVAEERMVPRALRDSVLNPGGFVTEEALRRMQTNEVYEGALENVYSPLGENVYTAQGVLPGVNIAAAG